MGLVNALLLIVGLICIVAGVLRLVHRSWIDGAVMAVLGLVLLACGGFIGT